MRCLIACTCQVFICAFTIWGPCILLSLRIRICWRNSGVFFYSTLPSQIWKVIFLFIKWEQIYVKLANFHLFQCVFRRKNADPQSVLANSINAIFFRIFSETSQKLSIQSIRRPKWHFISSRCLSSAIPERQYQIFVNYHKPSIHCFISFEALITWPI